MRACDGRNGSVGELIGRGRSRFARKPRRGVGSFDAQTNPHCKYRDYSRQASDASAFPESIALRAVLATARCWYVGVAAETLVFHWK